MCKSKISINENNVRYIFGFFLFTIPSQSMFHDSISIHGSLLKTKLIVLLWWFPKTAFQRIPVPRCSIFPWVDGPYITTVILKVTIKHCKSYAAEHSRILGNILSLFNIVLELSKCCTLEETFQQHWGHVLSRAWSEHKFRRFYGPLVSCVTMSGHGNKITTNIPYFWHYISTGTESASQLVIHTSIS